MIKLAMWQIHPRHWFLRTLSSWPCVWQRMWKADAVPAAQMHGIPKLGEEPFHHFRGYEGITEPPRSSFNVWTWLILLRQKCSIKQLLISADDVDFVSRCPGTTTAQTWIASRLCSPCWRGLPHGASSSETMRARKKRYSVQLVWTDVFTGRTGEGSWVHIPWMTLTVAGSCRFRRIFCLKTCFNSEAKRVEIQPDSFDTVDGSEIRPTSWGW